MSVPVLKPRPVRPRRRPGGRRPHGVDRPVLVLPSVPSSVCVPVVVEWDAVPGVHVARCDACADHFASGRLGEVEAWAERHRCDPELAALLALVDSRAAA